ncbi:MAG: hypothetical protein R3C59_12355 [Planctomycetaceae bacterium]
MNPTKLCNLQLVVWQFVNAFPLAISQHQFLRIKVCVSRIRHRPEESGLRRDLSRLGRGGIRVENPGDLRSAIEEALNTRKPFVVDVVCNGDELTMPPRFEFSQAWGYSLSKVKEFLLGGQV